MALGKAFIEVHADTKPFARELGRDLDKIVKASSKDIKVSARKVGTSISEGVSDGVKKDSKRRSREIEGDIKKGLLSFGFFGTLTRGLINTIDDGISGLPDELKVVLGAALIAALPLVFAFAGALVTAVTAAIGIATTVGIAALLGSQFVEVQNQWQVTLAHMRDAALRATSFLAGPILAALNQIEARFDGLLPAITRLAEIGASLFGPLVDSLFGLVEQALPGLLSGFGSLQRFMLPLQVGLRNIGAAVGQFFDEILNDPQAADAFYDILVFVEDLVRAFTALVKASLQVYGVLRGISEALGLTDPVSTEINQLAKDYGIAGAAAGYMGERVEGTVAPLTSQSEAVDNVNKELQTYTNLLFDAITNEIDFQEQIDDLSDSVKKNGTTLDIHTRQGRANANILLDMARNALAVRQNQIDLTGDVKNSQIEFEKQRQAIYDVAKQMHLSDAATKNLIGSLLLIPPPEPTGIDQGSINRLFTYYNKLLELRTLNASFGSVVSAGINAFGPVPHAMGGVYSRPHVGLVAEAGPEAIIPLNNPTRAAQVMAQAGLSGGTPPVNVYIGNSQIDAYIDNRVNSAMRATARSLSYGMRTA